MEEEVEEAAAALPPEVIGITNCTVVSPILYAYIGDRCRNEGGRGVLLALTTDGPRH